VVGAALNRTFNDELFRAAVLHVPFVDPLTAMLDASQPLTTMEYDEWGQPVHNVVDYDCIQTYCPYDHIPKEAPASRLPSIFVTAGMMDRRVPYWMPLKWTARLRHQLPAAYGSPVCWDDSERPHLISIIREDGDHFADSSDSVPEDTALWLSFLLINSKETT
jgi:hypothetical protein